ncbi:hypothetical protein ZIOFF_048276 [Zingiber officinale]|uniref:Uncharacterized protein n=1 Tax=Zingiber officinale TaxID=94328 RepID=A0A8J5FWB5_ZINOF|nr:hypothetical protein ZIOFF_048276 [Zingiber officinale]
MNSHDWALIHKIKKVITNYPNLAIPLEQCYIILETDGCMEGWGGICKWNPQKYDAKSEEKICAYASGKYSPIKSTIDAEIHADEQASFTQKNMTKDPIWPTLNGQELVMSSTTFESWSFSAKSRKTTSDEEAIMKDKPLTGKMPYQLSQKPDWTSGKPLCGYKR